MNLHEGMIVWLEEFENQPRERARILGLNWIDGTAIVEVEPQEPHLDPHFPEDDGVREVPITQIEAGPGKTEPLPTAEEVKWDLENALDILRRNLKLDDLGYGDASDEVRSAVMHVEVAVRILGAKEDE